VCFLFGVERLFNNFNNLSTPKRKHTKKRGKVEKGQTRQTALAPGDIEYLNVCRTVNKRLTQYGKARELKPFDEFVLFPHKEERKSGKRTNSSNGFSSRAFPYCVRRLFTVLHTFTYVGILSMDILLGTYCNIPRYIYKAV
jgi:hypothetical protein